MGRATHCHASAPGGGVGCATIRPMTAQQTQNWWWTAHPAAR
ncbi:trp operon leader peptide [Streptomyces sampsonii]|nr:trp operon leader peptide [Streptomyces sampsonii]NVI29401.1 trp operon leader peptide [Streptomyces sp. CAI-17]